MRLQNATLLYVVSQEGMTEMTFGRLHDALNGGTKMKEIEVFTDRSEAKEADRANRRRRQVQTFSRDEILRAAKMVLLDDGGQVIHGVPF